MFPGRTSKLLCIEKHNVLCPSSLDCCSYIFTCVEQCCVDGAVNICLLDTMTDEFQAQATVNYYRYAAKYLLKKTPSTNQPTHPPWAELAHRVTHGPPAHSSCQTASLVTTCHWNTLLLLWPPSPAFTHLKLNLLLFSFQCAGGCAEQLWHILGTSLRRGKTALTNSCIWSAL